MSNEAANDVSSLYPAPPPYIKFFTEENVKKLPQYAEELDQKKKNKTKNDEETGKEDDSKKVNDTDVREIMESELDFLIPPEMPKSRQYRAFGNVWQVKDELPDLEAMGITQLYKKSEHEEVVNYQYKIQELRRLLKSLLLNYLELVGILSINPVQYEAKVENIRTILVNIHHLLNEYRPHQSRESLIMLLEEQLEYKKEEIKNIEDVCKQVKEKLIKIQESLS